MLRNELVRLKPKIGDVVVIVYRGKREPASGTGSGYHAYSVVLPDRPPAEVDWNTFDEDAEPARSDIPSELEDDDVPF